MNPQLADFDHETTEYALYAEWLRSLVLRSENTWEDEVEVPETPLR